MLKFAKTFTDADKVSKELHNQFTKYCKESDAKGLTSLYHPDAVLVKKGKWVAYGHDEILKKNEEIVKLSFSDFEVKEKPATATTDGEFVHYGGSFEHKSDSSKNGWYAQIFKRGQDGKYLIFHDIFHM
uniref:DUF4440 domain-containing protein n=1 Tax=Panagrolaimus sp. ES5 TaxID=591445 RepID=A0AC34FY84_9BILA